MINWKERARDYFDGRVIIDARYLTEEEQEAIGWDAKCIVLQLDNGALVFPSQDDEGNGPGALFTNDPDFPVAPILR